MAPSPRLLASMPVRLGVAALLSLMGPTPDARQRRQDCPIALGLAPEAAWCGVDPAQRQGLLLLLKDHLELLGGLTVVEEANLEARSVAPCRRIRLGGRRTGDLLDLHLGEGIRTGPLPPAEAFARVMRHFSLRVPADHRILLPTSPAACWDLARATGAPMDQDPTPALALARGVAQQEPSCASAWATLAALSYWQLARQGDASRLEDFQAVEGLFRRAMALAPQYPRAVDDLVGFKTDQGDPRRAMELCFKALARYPRVAHLHGALVYPARCTGLLEGATRALARRDHLAGPHRWEREMVETTLLYTGQWARFEQGLGPCDPARPEPARDFYRGYVRLLQGRPREARGCFRSAQGRPGSWPQFEQLARGYQLGLEGRREAALEALRELRASRAKLQVPDGEFTFKMAEAFGFLVSPDEAMELATRAYAQGFSCQAWYLRSPFLAGLRGRPRWEALQQHLAERRALMGQAFPLSRFGSL